MKNINIKSILGLGVIIATVMLFSCNPQKKIAANYTYETECMGVELDGSQTLKAWGNGRNRRDAVEQAKKNAVRDVIFKGIRSGKSECNVKPLIVEVNAKEKYEDYFFKFFADGGLFAKFVSQKDESVMPKILKDRKSAGSEVTYGVIVRVMRQQIKQQLKEDNILK